MEIRINFNAGNDVEGLIIDSALQGVIMPNVTDAQAVVRSRELMKLMLITAHSLMTGSTSAQSQNYVEQHTTNIH